MSCTILLSWTIGSLLVVWLAYGYSLLLILPTILIILLTGLASLSYVYETGSNAIIRDPLQELQSPGSDGNPIPFKGIPHITRSVLSPSRKPRRERYLTGHSVIDEPLSDVLQLLFRDYILSWYSSISDDQSFLANIKDLFHEVVVNFSSKAKDVDWVNYLTIRMVDDFASHLRLFRQAQVKVRNSRKNDVDSEKPPVDLLSAFFSLETAMERSLCRDLVCISKEREIQYLQQVCEVLLYLLLPPADFQNKITRVFLRELVANIILLPLVDMITDPDYINQTIVWMYKDAVMTSEDFLAVLRCTDNLEELNATREIVNHEIAVQRSRDSGGEQDAEVKQQLNSLMYVKKTIESQMQRLEDGACDTDSTGLPCQMDWKKISSQQQLYSLTFEEVLSNNVALSHFIEFMSSMGAQSYISFYLNIEAFKLSAEQLLPHIEREKKEKGKGGLSTQLEQSIADQRQAAQSIYKEYLSEQATTKIPVDPKLTNKLLQRFQNEKFNISWFDDIQTDVMRMMQDPKYWDAFKKSTYYFRLLMDLDLVKDVSIKSDDDLDSLGFDRGLRSYGSGEDSASLNSMDREETVEFLTPPPQEGEVHEIDRPIQPPPGYEEESNPHGYLCASIYNTGIVRRGASSYALYAISVTRLDPGQIEEKWCVFRRYSDFHDFHNKVNKKFPHLVTTPFPAKRAFNNMSTVFLEQRKIQLNMYLQSLLQPNILRENLEMKQIVCQFLEPGRYEHHIKKSKKGVSAIVNPLKSSVKSVGSMVKNVPENIFDGLKDGLVKVLRSKPGEPLEDNSKVGAGIDNEADNIPLRILLLLMDEVFDLKSRNTWLRRRIVVILRQIIKATFGDTINRKIVDYVEFLTSSQQIAEYVKTIKNALWPNGVMAETRPERDVNTKCRTRVAAKMLLLCSVADDLKRIIGSETSRRGMLCVFEMFQNQALNRRLVYVLIEDMLAQLFPNNKFTELFREWHARSPTISMVSVHSGNLVNPDSGKATGRSPLATPEMTHRNLEGVR